MSLQITPEFERAVMERVESGAYENTEAVLDACIEALELMEADIAAEDVEWLEREIESAEDDEAREVLQEEVRRRSVH